ncbi:Ada metal-binding domain-containing protein [Persephonella sp. IF05-L8]|uniref:Ada metal-binding domain-containing protein n=1 Tax=Persephonella sp. IF05-L8 TaxID=1158338 RepID=UPI0004959BB7
MWFLVLLFFTSSAFSLEKTIIEDKGGYYKVETYQEYIPKKYNHKQHTKRKAHIKKKSRKKASYYVAKSKGKIFHRPDCRFAKRIKHKIVFKSRKKAVKSGLRPCKVCSP